ncbi:hypothetical protein ACLOJK_040663 [Asimina triloba]
MSKVTSVQGEKTALPQPTGAMTAQIALPQPTGIFTFGARTAQTALPPTFGAHPYPFSALKRTKDCFFFFFIKDANKSQKAYIRSYLIVNKKMEFNRRSGKAPAETTGSSNRDQERAKQEVLQKFGKSPPGFTTLADLQAKRQQEEESMRNGMDITPLPKAGLPIPPNNMDQMIWQLAEYVSYLCQQNASLTAMLPESKKSVETEDPTIIRAQQDKGKAVTSSSRTIFQTFGTPEKFSDPMEWARYQKERAQLEEITQEDEAYASKGYDCSLLAINSSSKKDGFLKKEWQKDSWPKDELLEDMKKQIRLTTGTPRIRTNSLFNFQVTYKPHGCQEFAVNAILDTGATKCCIDPASIPKEAGEATENSKWPTVIYGLSSNTEKRSKED